MEVIKTFAIETSCDDTSIAVVNFDGSKFEVEKILSYSQTLHHQKYGGVVPEVASRLHEEKIIALLEEFGKENIKNIDFISVTAEPGLPGSLIVGITTAYTLGNFLDKEVIEVNHIYGHIFSLFLERKIEEIKLPMVVLTASGGHNEIYYITQITEDLIRRLSEDRKLFMIDRDIFCDIDKDNLGLKQGHKLFVMKIGQTLDDAAGEVFDKVARMLGGPYPGGPWISDKAKLMMSEDEKQKISEDIVGLINKKISPIFLSSDKFDFSFSGHKSQIYYLLKELEKRGVKLDEDIVSYIAYKFQEVVVEVLAKKLVKAAVKYGAKTIGISGGVSANDRFFEYIKELVEKYKAKKMLLEDVKVLRPIKKMYSTDNAAMIGAVGILKKLGILNGKRKKI